MFITQMPRKLTQKQGFSLIEVMVAIAVIAIAMGTLSYLITALRNTAKSDESTAASNFSRTYIDVLRSRWQIPAEYRRGGGPGGTAVVVPLTEPPAVFDEYSVLVENLNVRRNPATVLTSTSFTYKRGTTTTADYTPPRASQDVLRRVTITMKGRDGKDLTPFVTEIAAPTLTVAP